MSRQRLYLFVGMVVLTVSILACSGQKRITSAEAESALPPTSPENVLQNIAYAYQTLDIDLYRDQFDSNLKLLFPPEMQKYLDEIPESDFEWDMTSTSNIFRTSEWITFEVSFDPPGPSTVDGYTGKEFVEINAHSVQIEIKRIDTDDSWLVTDDEAILVLKKDASVNPATFQVVYMHYLNGFPDDSVE